MKPSFAVAIDGPAGAGKSTMARILAKELGFLYVDTGALYRTVGYYALVHHVDPSDEAAVKLLLHDVQLELRYVEDVQHVFLNGEDVSGRIRTPDASMAASAVSAMPAVRAFLLDRQRQLAETNRVIMDGRDIGTVVLPQAELKIFLTASPEARAKRRFMELQEKGTAVSYEDVLADMVKRDYNDSHRETAPLKPAEDAVWVDTTDKTLEQAVEILKNLVKEALQ